MTIGVGVYGAAWDEKLFAAMDYDAFAVDGPGGGAVHADDALVVLAMKMRDEHVGVWGDGHLEEIEGAIGIVATFDKGDSYVSNADERMHFTPV